MKVLVNGVEREVEDQSTIRALLDQLGLNREGVAVAVDQRVVPRSTHAEQTLSEGATVEVIRAVGGG